ncbi:MAG: LPP20 family lipoprotein, partial [Spirochaetales bacterium]|nr:LPP20 family lipoprotein [Spirochaetales bacterium]
PQSHRNDRNYRPVKVLSSHISLKSLCTTLVFIAAFCSCAAAPPPAEQHIDPPAAQPPLWARDAEAVYPAERYIAQKGYGPSREQAEASGLEAISRYFASEVKSTASSSLSYTERDGAVSQSRQVDESVFIQTQTRLFAVRYTEAWHNRVRGEWETLAYIDRAEAWAMYEPGLRQKADAFRAVYGAAETAEALKAFYLYSAARNLAADIPPLLDFAQILHLNEAARFGDVRNAIAALPQKIDAARTETVVYLECPRDSGAAVYSAFAQAFSAGGFATGRDKKTASAVCAVTVEENIQKLEAGTFYYPSVTASLADKTGVLFTYSFTLGRTGAFNPDVAKQRAYAAIAQEIQNSFLKELNKKMNDF